MNAQAQYTITVVTDGTNGKDGKSITNTSVMWYLSTSNTTQTGGSWVAEPPTWVEGKYYWYKLVIEYSDKTSTESPPVMVSGGKGGTGQGIANIEIEFYLSTSKTEQTGGSWSTTRPVWERGKYLWTRNKITYKNPTATEYTTPICDSTWEIANDLEEDYNNKFDDVNSGLVQLRKDMLSSIEQEKDRIMMTVSESYYTKGDTEKLISELETIFTQTKDNFEMQFNKFSQDLEDLNNGTNANFEEYRKYIRFEDGNIVLGEVGNELTLKIEKDKVGFYQNNNMIGYYGNSKFYIVDGEVTHSLKIGNFAFVPRANGSLDFKKVGI